MQSAFSVLLFLPALILIVLGVMVKYYKAYWLISGYNTMSKEKKKNVDVVGLSRMVGNFSFVMAAIIFLAGALLLAIKIAAAGIVFALIVPTSIFMIIQGQKYDGNTRNPDGTMNKKTKIIIGAIVSLLVFTSIGVGILIIQSNKPAEFIVAEGCLEIKGLYGGKIDLREVEEIALILGLPEITRKTNGSALGDRLKGNFRLKDVGEAKLFLDRGKPPFIYIEGATKPVIINSVSEKETNKLYNVLFAEWKKAKE